MTFPNALKKQLIRLLGADYVKDDRVTLYSYQCDAQVLHGATPMGVVWPDSAEAVQGVVRLLHREGITFLPRGAGTGLSGGAIPENNAVIIETARLNRVLGIDPVNRSIEVEPGVVNINISNAARPHGLCFVPDPSSQKACTIGGNAAENSGGPHTLKYGVTVNHVMGMDLILPDGELVTLGADHFCSAGPDLTGLAIGSEGTFGIVTKVICRLTPLPEDTITMLAVFDSVRGACEAVSGIIRAGIVPAALEMMDQVTIEAVQKARDAGFPRDAAAVLIIELEDLNAGIDAQALEIESVLEASGATRVSRARDQAERDSIWAARKGAFGAIGQLSPSYYTQDGVIPRSRLPEVLDKILEIGRGHGLTIANVFHAGDGNLHPLILYDYKNEDEVKRCEQAGEQILRVCVNVGGSLSGEHGIGLEKSGLMDQVFNSEDLENMKRVRDVFNPDNLLNPGKIFPQPGRCAEVKGSLMNRGVEA